MADSQLDREFFRNAVLHTIVPEVSNAKLPDALDDTIEGRIDEDESLIPIKQRTHLFFGKYIPLL